MNNPWISYVKKIQKENNISYSEAMILSKETYKKKKKKRARVCPL